MLPVNFIRTMSLTIVQFFKNLVHVNIGNMAEPLFKTFSCEKAVGVVH